MPRDVIKAKCESYRKRGKPERRDQMVNDDDHTIVRTYGAEYRGLVEYYLPAGDVYRLNRLEGVMKTSMLKTLACKHDSTVTTMANRYKTTITTPYGPRRCFEVSTEREGRTPLIARFGGIPLRRKKNAVLTDRVPSPVTVRRKELVTRLQAGRCELCTQTATVDAHHVGKLADLARPGKPQPVWDRLMAKRRRKTLIVCVDCHATIHDGQPTATPTQDVIDVHVLQGREPARQQTTGTYVRRSCSSAVDILMTVDQDTGRRTGPEPLRALADYRRAAAGGVVFGAKFTVLHPGKLSVGDEVIVSSWRYGVGGGGRPIPAR